MRFAFLFDFHHFVDPSGGEFGVETAEGQPTKDTVKARAARPPTTR